MPSDNILSNFHKTTQVPKLKGKHTEMSTSEEVLTLVDHLLPANVFGVVPGRVHEDMPSNLLDAIDCKKLKT